MTFEFYWKKVPILADITSKKHKFGVILRKK